MSRACPSGLSQVEGGGADYTALRNSVEKKEINQPYLPNALAAADNESDHKAGYANQQQHHTKCKQGARVQLSRFDKRPDRCCSERSRLMRTNLLFHAMSYPVLALATDFSVMLGRALQDFAGNIFSAGIAQKRFDSARRVLFALDHQPEFVL
jgi:hypothetical protein